MAITPEHIKMVDAYVHLEMSDEQMTAFELEMDQNPELNKYCHDELELIEQLEVMEFKKSFPEFDLDNIIVNPYEVTFKISPQENKKSDAEEQPAIRAVSTPAGKINSSKRWIQLAVAASVIGIIISIIWIKNNRTVIPSADSVAVNPVTQKDSSNKSAGKEQITKATKTGIELFADYFEEDKVPEEKPLILLAELDGIERKDFTLIQKLDADHPKSLKGIDDDELNSKQNIKELGHYYKGYSYIVTGNNNLAKQNLQWVIDNAQNKKLLVKAQWYLALCYLKDENKVAAISLLKLVEINIHAKPYDIHAKELLVKLNH